MFECPKCNTKMDATNERWVCSGDELFGPYTCFPTGRQEHHPEVMVAVTSGPTVGQRVKVEGKDKGTITHVYDDGDFLVSLIGIGQSPFGVCAYGTTVLPDNAPYVGQRVKLMNEKHGLYEFWGVVSSLDDQFVQVQWERGSSPEFNPHKCLYKITTFEELMTPDDNPATGPVSTPTACHRCHQPNTYENPANRPGQWWCTGCRLWESLL